MNWRILLSLLAAALLTVSCAQNETSSPTSSDAVASALGEGAEGPMRWVEELGMTDEQAAQVQAIFESHRAEREAIREARRNGTSREETQAQHEALKTKVHEELAGVLTAEQLAKLEELHQNRPRHRRGQMTEEYAAHLDERLAKLTEELGLTPEQATQLRALFEERHASRPARGEGPRDPEVREQHRAEFLSQMETILTPEQLEEFKSLHKGRGLGRRHGGSGGPHGFGRGQG